MNDLLPLIEKYVTHKNYILCERKMTQSYSYNKYPFQNEYHYYFFNSINNLHSILINKILKIINLYRDINPYLFIYKNNELIYEILSYKYFNIDVNDKNYIDLSSIDEDNTDNNQMEIYNQRIKLHCSSPLMNNIRNKTDRTIFESIYLCTIDNSINININTTDLFNILSYDNIIDVYNNVVRKKLDTGKRFKIDGQQYFILEQNLSNSTYAVLDKNTLINNFSNNW